MPDKRPKKPSMAEALGSRDTGGLLSFFERAALDSSRGRQSGEGAGMLNLQVEAVPLDVIVHNPRQSRQAFDIKSLKELAASIREHGVLEPIIVRSIEKGNRFEIVAGERRYRAAAMAEQESIPARIMELDDRQAALVTALENLQREDLDIEDEARQFADLCEVLGVSQRELARMLGKHPVYISRRIRLLKRPELMESYRSGRLTLLQAAALADPSSSAEEEDLDAEKSDSLRITPGEDEEGDSLRITSPGASGEAGVQLELVEREDLPGFIVARTVPTDSASQKTDSARITSPGHTAAKRPLFRWRPLQQFYNWVGRTHVTDIPRDERATVRAQLNEIKEALEKQLAELDQIQD